jgi:hypothetical protein
MKTGGRSCLKPGLFAPFDAAVHGIMCWFTSTFLGTLGSFENIFSTFFAPVDVVIGAGLPDFRVSGKKILPNSAHLGGLSDGF